MFVDRDRAAAVAVGARDIRGDIKGIVNQPLTLPGTPLVILIDGF